MKRWFRLIGAASFMVAVSLLLWVCGYDGRLQFNKGLVSLCCFGVAYRWLPETFRHWKQDRRRFFYSYGISVFLALTEMMGLWLWRKENTDLALNGAMAVIVLFFCVWILAALLEPFFYWLSGWNFLEKGMRVSLSKIFFFSWMVFTAAYVPCLLAFYPGLYTYDMSWQWQQFLGYGYTTHHPLIHTFFASWLIELGNQIFGDYQKGLFLHSVVQMLIMTGSMAFAMTFLVKWKVPKNIWIGIGCFFAFFPFFPVLGISTTKDTVFGCLFLMTFVCICDMEIQKQLYKGWKMAAFVILAILACLFRNNMVYGLALMEIGLFMIVVWRIHRKKVIKPLAGVCAVIAVVIVGSHLGFAGLENTFHALKGSKAEMLSLPMQQMARAYVRHTDELDEEDRMEMERFFEKDWLTRYRYYLSDPVKKGMNMELVGDEPAEFLKLWARLGKQFPSEYIEAPLYNTFGLWYLGGDSSCYMEYKMTISFDEKHHVELQSKLPAAQSYYSWFQDQNLHRYLPGVSMIFYTSFYLWLILLCGWYLLVQKRYTYLFGTVFLLAYGATLVFGPCILPRYCLGLMVSAPVLAAVTFMKQKEM